MTRARYRAAKDRILKMSIYDQKSMADTQAMISQFFYLSGIYNITIRMKCSVIDDRECIISSKNSGCC